MTSRFAIFTLGSVLALGTACGDDSGDPQADASDPSADASGGRDASSDPDGSGMSDGYEPCSFPTTLTAGLSQDAFYCGVQLCYDPANEACEITPNVLDTDFCASSQATDVRGPAVLVPSDGGVIGEVAIPEGWEVVSHSHGDILPSGGVASIPADTEVTLAIQPEGTTDVHTLVFEYSGKDVTITEFGRDD